VFKFLEFLLFLFGPIAFGLLPADEDPPVPPDDEDDPPSDDPGADGGSDTGAPYCTTGSRTFQSVVVNGSSSTASYRMRASFSNNTSANLLRRRINYYKDGVAQSGGIHGTSTATSSSWNSTSNGQTDKNLECDNNQYSWRGRFANLTEGGEENGATFYFKSHAIPMTASTPTSSNVAATEAYITCDYFPNSKHSTVTALLQYKRTVDSEWTAAGDPADSNGYTQVTTFGRGITGLTPETQYDFRLVLSRNSVNSTSLISATASFNTIADAPDVTTNAATGITAGVQGVSSDGVATLNGSVDRNGKTDTEWRFAWGKVSGALDIFSSSWTATTTEPESVQEEIGSLDESTTYYFELQVRWNSGASTDEGSELSFPVPADPGADAKDDEFVTYFKFDRKYGVATTVTFSLMQSRDTGSDQFITLSSPFAAGDVKVMQDADGTYTNVGTLPTQVSAGKALYTLSLTAAEMQGEYIDITMVDAAGAAWRDVHIQIRTSLVLGNADIDSTTGAKANTSALKLSGYTAGHGLETVGGATGSDIYGILLKHSLSSGTMQSGTGASAVLASAEDTADDTYNGAVILFYAGTGAGQARTITDHVNGTDTITLNKDLSADLGADTKYVILPGEDEWRHSPVVELAGLPVQTSYYSEMLQLVWQRIAHEKRETATVHTLFEEDGATSFAQSGVDNDGTTETKNKLEDV